MRTGVNRYESVASDVSDLKLTTHLKFVAWEAVFLGAFLLAILSLQLYEDGSANSVGSFALVYGIIGVTLVLVGLEGVSLVGKLPKD